jgi:hypothetical protein
MEAIVEKITVIDKNWLEANRNERVDEPLSKRFEDYFGRTNGAYRGLKFVQFGTKLGNAVVEKGGYSLPAVTQFEMNVGTGANALVIPRVPVATKAARQSLIGVTEEDGTPLSRRVAKAVRDTTDAIAALGFCAIFIKYNPLVLRVAQVADLTTDTTDLHISVQDYRAASSLEQQATGEAKEALAHTRRYNFLRILKAATGVAGTILGLTLIITGVALIPIIAFVALALFSTSLAISRDVYKDMGYYKVVDLDRPILLI